MSNELVKSLLTESLELGSLAKLVKASEVVMLLIDTSSSMLSPVEYGGIVYRIGALREVVAQIKTGGHVPMIAFGGAYGEAVRFVDAVPDPNGGTPLHLAIPFAKQHGATRLVVISDGCPDLAEQSMIEAKVFGGRIDVCFVGTPGEGGDTFLDQLAKATGGEQFNGDLRDPKALSGQIVGLLVGEVEPEKGPIVGPGFSSVEPDDEPDPFEDDDDDDDDDDDEEDADDDDE